jgi:LCP family protein required for cell wall assembly
MTATPPGRPPGDGAPREGTPEYEWLYGGAGDSESGSGGTGKHRAGDATRPVPRQERPERPEETQVMPVQPPSQSRAAVTGRERRAQLKSDQERQTLERASRPTPPPLAPPPGQGSTRRGFRFRFRFRYVFLLLFLWLVFLVLVPLIAWNKVSKIDAMPSGDRPGDQPGTTYLLVGSDSRADLSPEERKELNTGVAGGQRTDTIMLLHTGSGPNLLMSIPRDSLVPIPGHGTTKINAATAYGGPKLMVRTVELNTGIRIDSYVEIGFGGFVGLVDAVGGIEICPKENMVDADANLEIKKGCQDVDGPVALAYARSRHAQQLGDLDRAAHQREVVAAVGRKAVSPWSIVNPLRYWRLNMAGADFVAIDDETGPVAAAQLALAMTQVGGSGADAEGLTCGVPITDLAVHWDTERAKQMFQLIQTDDTARIGKDLCTPSGLK